MKRILWLAVLGSMIVSVPAAAGGIDATQAFEQIKGLAGTWHGEPEAEGLAAEAEVEHPGEVVHEFRVSAAGTVVMEMMGPGTDYEMINMYHLDGDDLVLTHYCAGGNQPTMKLNREASSTGSAAGVTPLPPA